MRPWTPVVILALVGRIAVAHPKPPPIWIADDDREPPEEVVDWRQTPALLEWSTWLGFGFGAASDGAPAPSTARTTGTVVAAANAHTAWTFSAGVEATVPVAHHARIGPWIGLHDLEPMAGGELQITHAPGHLDLFFYPGEGVWTVRAGGGPDHATAALAWGYRCPWRLWGPYTRGSRYEIGPRITLAVTRAYRDPADWSATLGLEVEPVGALRYLLGIKSWY
jgi:hypothetical protein